MSFVKMLIFLKYYILKYWWQNWKSNIIFNTEAILIELLAHVHALEYTTIVFHLHFVISSILKSCPALRSPYRVSLRESELLSHMEITLVLLCSFRVQVLPKSMHSRSALLTTNYKVFRSGRGPNIENFYFSCIKKDYSFLRLSFYF